MSFNRKTTHYAFDSVTTALRRAPSESDLDSMLTEADATYTEASASTRRKWRKAAEVVRTQLRAKSGEPA